MICSVPTPDTKIQSHYCLAKYISRNNLKVDVHFNISRPLAGTLIHFDFYYKFNGLIYQKFPIDIWEDYCDWMDQKSVKHYLLDWFFQRLFKYSNLQHRCPHIGYKFVKADNISLDDFFSFELSLLPSGRYHLDITFTENDRIPMALLQIYFSVSDHRLEKV